MFYADVKDFSVILSVVDVLSGFYLSTLKSLHEPPEAIQLAVLRETLIIGRPQARRVSALNMYEL